MKAVRYNGTMHRVTIRLPQSLHAVTWDVLVSELMPLFELERDEVNALLKADAIVLEPELAREVIAICQALGIPVDADQPAPARRRWRRAALIGAATLGVALGLSWRLIQGEATAPAVDAMPSAWPAEAALPVIDSLEQSAPDLFSAARDLTADEVRAALVRTSAVDLRDAYGQTPLMYAAAHNIAEVAQLLIRAGADVNARTLAGWTPLMYAARNRAHPEVLELLLNAGADPLARNQDGETALEVARREGGEAQQALLAAATPIPIPVPVPGVRVIPAVPQSALPLPADLQAQQRALILACLNDWDNCDGTQ